MGLSSLVLEGIFRGYYHERRMVNVYTNLRMSNSTSLGFPVSIMDEIRLLTKTFGSI